MTKQTLSAIYGKSPDEWPAWLSEEEQNNLIETAKTGRNWKEKTQILAALLYLGLTPGQALKLTYQRIDGDALEEEKRKHFLHIPLEYRYVIYSTIDEEHFPLCGDRVTKGLLVRDAVEEMRHMFWLAGMREDPEWIFLRIRRTSARLHETNCWMWENDICNWWWEDIRFIDPDKSKLYYKSGPVGPINRWIFNLKREEQEKEKNGFLSQEAQIEAEQDEARDREREEEEEEEAERDRQRTEQQEAAFEAEMQRKYLGHY